MADLTRIVVPGEARSCYPASMKYALCLFLFILAPVLQAGTHALSAEQWAVPRRAEVIIEMPAIKNAILELQKTPQGRLILHYPGGDSGTLWVRELRSWLVSLGVPTAVIEITPGSQNQQMIELEVVKPVASQHGPQSR